MNKEQKLPTSRQTIFQEATTPQPIENLIFEIRGQQVMLDRDLAMLYGVETKRLNEQVRRNSERFPEDFMFQLNQYELAELEVANCDFQFGADGIKKMSLRFHREWSCNVKWRSEISYSRCSKHTNHESIYDRTAFYSRKFTNLSET